MPERNRLPARPSAPGRAMDRPECGYWLTRMVRNGPYVCAAILRLQTRSEPDNPSNLMDRSPFMCAFLNGDPVDISTVWLRRGTPITGTEYAHRLRVSRRALQHAPDSPEANPKTPVDLKTMPPLYSRTK